MKGKTHIPALPAAQLTTPIAILQRVLSASVTVDKELISSIGKGVLVLAAVAPSDTEKEIDALAQKILRMKLWDNEETGQRWKHSVSDIAGEVLCVSQFTLLANTHKGTKPDFHGAMGGERAKELYQRFVEKVREGYEGERVKDGVFQAMMQVALVNDGPVTLEMSVENVQGKPVKQKNTPNGRSKGKVEYELPSHIEG
jgi:D-tyrosyl-tRNA(Tyr) deacylase